MLCDWHGFFCGWNPGTFLQDLAAVLHTPNLQLLVVLSSIVRSGPMSEAPCSKVRVNELFIHRWSFSPTKQLIY